jgi:hypothetical protein
MANRGQGTGPFFSGKVSKPASDGLEHGGRDVLVLRRQDEAIGQIAPGWKASAMRCLSDRRYSSGHTWVRCGS